MDDMTWDFIISVKTTDDHPFVAINSTNEKEIYIRLLASAKSYFLSSF